MEAIADAIKYLAGAIVTASIILGLLVMCAS